MNVVYVRADICQRKYMYLHHATKRRWSEKKNSSRKWSEMKQQKRTMYASKKSYDVMTYAFIIISKLLM